LPDLRGVRPRRSQPTRRALVQRRLPRRGGEGTEAEAGAEAGEAPRTARGADLLGADVNRRKTSLRHGLPYGWWRDDRLRLTLLAALSVAALAVMGAYLTSAWWFW